jgi:hypothetical protein
MIASLFQFKANHAITGELRGIRGQILETLGNPIELPKTLDIGADCMAGTLPLASAKTKRATARSVPKRQQPQP